MSDAGSLATICNSDFRAVQVHVIRAGPGIRKKTTLGPIQDVLRDVGGKKKNAEPGEEVAVVAWKADVKKRAVALQALQEETGRAGRWRTLEC